MLRKLALTGLILITVALLIIAITDPLLRVLLFGVRGLSGQFASGIRQYNSTFRQTFSANLQLRSYLIAFLSFGIAIVGLILSFLGFFVSKGGN